MKVVIDGDSIPYAVGFAAKGEPINFVLATVRNAVNNIMEESGCDEYELYIKGEGNFRDELAFTKPYKGTRKSAKPPYFDEMIEFMKEHLGAIPVNDMEADDKVSLELYKDYVYCGGDPAICNVVVSSADKDLNNTPGWHHNPRTKKLYWVNDTQASRHFWYQMLRGDPVDNITGLPAITSEMAMKYDTKAGACGEARAKKIMAFVKKEKEDGKLAGHMVVMDCYMSYGEEKGWSEEATLEYFVEQAQLLWMTRELDWTGTTPIMYLLRSEELEETYAYRGRYRDPARYTYRGPRGTGDAGGDEDEAPVLTGWESPDPDADLRREPQSDDSD